VGFVEIFSATDVNLTASRKGECSTSMNWELQSATENITPTRNMASLLQGRNLIPLVVKTRSVEKSEAGCNGVLKCRFGIAGSITGEESYRTTDAFPMINVYHEPEYSNLRRQRAKASDLLRLATDPVASGVVSDEFWGPRS